MRLSSYFMLPKTTNSSVATNNSPQASKASGLQNVFAAAHANSENLPQALPAEAGRQPVIPIYQNKSVSEVFIQIPLLDAIMIQNFMHKNHLNQAQYPTLCSADLSTKNLNKNNISELNHFEKYAYDKKNYQVQIIIKTHRVKLLKAIEEHLKSKLGIPNAQDHENNKKTNKIKIFFKKVFFWFASTLGALFGGITSYLGLQGLLKAIFIGITAPILIPVTLFCTLIESILFIYFERALLQEAMGIDNRSRLKECLDLDEIEMDLFNSIQLVLMPKAANHCGETEIGHFNEIRKIGNETIRLKKNFYKNDLKENALQKFLHTVITVIGGFLVVAGAYFATTSLIVYLTAFLAISGPIGWIIIGCGMLTSLAFYLVMRGKAVLEMFLPEIEQYKSLQDRLKNTTDIDIEIENIPALLERVNALNQEKAQLEERVKKVHENILTYVSLNSKSHSNEEKALEFRNRNKKPKRSKSLGVYNRLSLV